MIGDHALDRFQLADRSDDRRDRTHQPFGVWVLSMVEDSVDVGFLDNPAQVHDHNRVGCFGDHTQIVGD